MAAPAPLVKFNPASVSSLNVPKKERRIMKKEAKKLIPAYRSQTKLGSGPDYQVRACFGGKLVLAGSARPILYGRALRLRSGFDLKPAEPRECNFPARALREFRHQVRSEINQFPADISNDSHEIQSRLRLIKAIDYLRSVHEAVSGCGCQYSPEEIKAHVTAAERNSAE